LGLRLGSGWGASPNFETNPELQALLRGIAGIPDSTFGRIPGLTIARASTSAIDPTRAGEYSFANHTVTLFNNAFTVSLTRFGTPGASLSDTTSFTVRHEIGHALDQVSLRTALGSWNASVTSLNTQVARQHSEFGDGETSPNRFQIPADRRAAWNTLQQDIAAAQTTERNQAARATPPAVFQVHDCNGNKAPTSLNPSRARWPRAPARFVRRRCRTGCASLITRIRAGSSTSPKAMPFSFPRPAIFNA
jgi:hypothetical protein